MNYRLLNEKEIKQEGDERYLQISLGGNHKWTVIDSKEVGQVFGREWDDSPVRRKMDNYILLNDDDIMIKGDEWENDPDGYCPTWDVIEEKFIGAPAKKMEDVNVRRKYV